MAAPSVRLSLPHQWAPRPYQQKLWNYLSRGGKRAVARYHRRAGKDDVFLHHTACAAHQRVGNYWYLLPEYAQARKSMWDAINPKTGKRRIDEAFPREIRKGFSEQEMMIEFHSGSTFQLVGSDNYDSLVGSPPVGVVFSEYALSNPAAWAYLMPILEENGGWAGFNSTPRGKNHFKNLCEFAEKEMNAGEDWFYEALTARDTGVFTEQQLESILRELQSTHGKDFGKALWMQEYFVSFDAAIPGSIFGEWMDRAQLQGRITEVPVQPQYPVNTAWDLGRTDATAIWFYQIFKGEIHVIGYHESSLKDIPYYADLLREKKKLWGIEYGTHWLPHDARARHLAAGGKSIQQQMIDQNVGRVVIAPRLDHVDGIQAARRTIPYCWFDANACEPGVEVLRAYHYEWDAERRVFLATPEHDWSSHGASAFRTLSLSWKQPRDAPPDRPIADRLLEGNPTGMTFGAMKRAHFKRMREQRLH